MTNDTTLYEIYRTLGVLEAMQSIDVRDFVEKETTDILIALSQESAA